VPTDRAADQAAALRAVAEPIRLRVVWLLRPGPLPVGKIAEALGKPRANTSHHLILMHRAGVLTATREGLFIRYGLAPAAYDAGPPASLDLAGLRLLLPD
jgi:ArsR family transcriptional regulator